MEQRLAGPKLKVWQGCLLVVLVAVFLFAAQFVLTFLQYALTYFRILDGADRLHHRLGGLLAAWAACWA